MIISMLDPLPELLVMAIPSFRGVGNHSSTASSLKGLNTDTSFIRRLPRNLEFMQPFDLTSSCHVTTLNNFYPFHGCRYGQCCGLVVRFSVQLNFNIPRSAMIFFQLQNPHKIATGRAKAPPCVKTLINPDFCQFWQCTAMRILILIIVARCRTQKLINRVALY